MESYCREHEKRINSTDIRRVFLWYLPWSPQRAAPWILIKMADVSPSSPTVQKWTQWCVLLFYACDIIWSQRHALPTWAEMSFMAFDFNTHQHDKNCLNLQEKIFDMYIYIYLCAVYKLWGAGQNQTFWTNKDPNSHWIKRHLPTLAVERWIYLTYRKLFLQPISAWRTYSTHGQKYSMAYRSIVIHQPIVWASTHKLIKPWVQRVYGLLDLHFPTCLVTVLLLRPPSCSLNQQHQHTTHILFCPYIGPLSAESRSHYLLAKILFNLRLNLLHSQNVKPFFWQHRSSKFLK